MEYSEVCSNGSFSATDDNICQELSVAPFIQSKGRETDYLNCRFFFEFDSDTGKYYINARNVCNELPTVMSATYSEGAEVDMPSLRQQAKLASVFLSALSGDAEDAVFCVPSALACHAFAGSRMAELS